MAAVELNRRIDAISPQPASWRCPYCGLIHRKTRLRLYAAALWVLAALMWLLAPETQASANPNLRQIAPRAFPATALTQAEPTITMPPTPTELPAPTPEFALQTPPSPTPLPIPKTGVVWAETSASAYLYAEPGLEIVTAIPNGQFVQLRDEFATYGNLPWTKVVFAGQTGWLDATKVNRVRYEGETFLLVAADGGTFLYTAPQEQQIAWLPEGTPLRFEQANQEWAEVSTLGGQTGWVLLESITPPNEASN